MEYPEGKSSYNGLGLAEGEMARECFEGLRKVLKRGGSASDPVPLPCLRVVDVEMTETYLHKARDLGLSDDWIQRIIASRMRRPVTASLDEIGRLDDLDKDVEKLAGEQGGYHSSDEDDLDESQRHLEILTPRYSVITIRRIPAYPINPGTSSHVANESTTLREGDLILTINNRLVCHMRDLVQVISSADQLSTDPVVLHILRDGEELDVLVPTRLLSGVTNPQLVQWAGALFQPPHRAMQFHTKYVPRGVYTSVLYSGSPAQRDGVSAAWFLTEIDGKPVHDLESLIAAVEDTPVPVVDPIGKEGWSRADAVEEEETWETRSFRVKMVSLELVQKVCSAGLCHLRSHAPADCQCGGLCREQAVLADVPRQACGGAAGSQALITDTHTFPLMAYSFRTVADVDESA